MRQRIRGRTHSAWMLSRAASGVTAGILIIIGTSHAQELEPRAYSAAPVGTNFVLVNYSHLSGQVLTDPSLPIDNVNAKIDIYTAGYLRTFALAGRLASVGVLVPYARLDATGEVFDAPAHVNRAGMGDLRARIAINLIGNPALPPKEFAQSHSMTNVGASLSIVAPTGQYVPSRLINVGTNRWAFKPEIGVSQPIGNWFAEATAGVWLYTDNRDFFGGHRRGQDALSVYQVHAGYNFRPGLWLAVDGAYYGGGQTTVDGVPKQDLQKNTRYGATLSIPIDRSWSAKLAWSKGLATRVGGDYNVVGFTLQYRWFD